MKITLSNSTGCQTTDTILQGIVGIFESMFPDSIRAYYLSGSYADGTAVASSDIDLLLFFGKALTGKEVYVRQYCQMLSRVRLDIDIIPEPYNLITHWASISTQVKLGGLLIYGEDIRERIPMIPIMEYARIFMHFPYPKLVAFRTDDGSNRHYPFTYPDRDVPFYGYIRDEKRIGDGLALNTTKALVNCMANMTNAIVAWKAKRYVRNTAECFQLYREYIGDEWAEFLYETHQLCRNEWHYTVPEDDSAARAKLQTICKNFLAVENHFLRLYKTFLLEELEMDTQQTVLIPLWLLKRFTVSSETTLDDLQSIPANHQVVPIPNWWRLAASKRLQDIFPADPDVRKALQRLEISSGIE